MHDSTLDTIRVVLKGDDTLAPAERNRLLALIRSPARPDKPTLPPRILRRAEVAQRHSVSLRTVDSWAQQGLLPKFKLPGRSRALGFRESDVDALIEGGPSNE